MAVFAASATWFLDALGQVLDFNAIRAKPLHQIGQSLRAAALGLAVSATQDRG